MAQQPHFFKEPRNPTTYGEYFGNQLIEGPITSEYFVYVLCNCFIIYSFELNNFCVNTFFYLI